jgi:hypothetical protein
LVNVAAGRNSKEVAMSVRFSIVDGRVNTHRLADQKLLSACRAGLEPAEALPSYARDWLVTDLVCEGWTDVEIATWTRMTTYTTTRIRERLRLSANMIKGAVA